MSRVSIFQKLKPFVSLGIGASLTLLFVFFFNQTPDAKRERTEAEALDRWCLVMIDNLRNGKSELHDYLATQCPVRLLDQLEAPDE